MAIPTIPVYTGGVANPDGSQDQQEFTTNMFNQLSYEAALAPSLNDTVNEMNAVAGQVDTNAAIAQNSADAAQAAAKFEGEFAVGVTNAEKGKSYSYNGEVWLCLQNTTTIPSLGAVEWKLSVGEQYVTTAQGDVLGGELFKGSNGETVEVGDSIEPGITHLRVLVSGEPRIVKIKNPPEVGGTVDSIDASEGSVTIDGIVYNTFLAGPNIFCSSDFNSITEILKLNKGSSRVIVIVDSDSLESENVSYSGSIELKGEGVITLASGVTTWVSHSSGELVISPRIEITTQDPASTTNIMAFNGLDVSNYSVYCTLNRVKIVARNTSLQIGQFKFGGEIKGDYSDIPTGIDDAVLDVRNFNVVDLTGMENESTGCERLVKSSNTNETLILKGAKLRGSTKRQVIDGYFDTKKIIVHNNDIDIDCTSLFENKLTDLGGGMYPDQVLFSLKGNNIKSTSSGALSVLILQTPRGTAIPTDTKLTLINRDNTFDGDFSDGHFDLKGLYNYLEGGNTYLNNDPARYVANFVACELINIESMPKADAYSAVINGTGASTGGEPYSLSTKKLNVSDVDIGDFNNSGMLYLLNCDSVENVTIKDSLIKNGALSTSSLGVLTVRDSTIAKVKYSGVDSSGVQNGNKDIRLLSGAAVTEVEQYENRHQKYKQSISSFSIDPAEEVTFTETATSEGAGTPLQFGFTGVYDGVDLYCRITASECVWRFVNNSASTISVGSGTLHAQISTF